MAWRPTMAVLLPTALYPFSIYTCPSSIPSMLPSVHDCSFVTKAQRSLLMHHTSGWHAAQLQQAKLYLTAYKHAAQFIRHNVEHMCCYTPWMAAYNHYSTCMDEPERMTHHRQTSSHGVQVTNFHKNLSSAQRYFWLQEINKG